MFVKDVKDIYCDSKISTTIHEHFELRQKILLILILTH